MASVPASADYSLVARSVALDVTSAETNAAGDTYEQLFSWNLRGSHPESEVPFGAGSSYSYGRGSFEFDFSVWASETLAERVEAAYKFGSGRSGQLPLRFYHLKYWTDQGGSTPKYINFSARIKSLAVSRQGGQESLVAVACSTRLQNANYQTAGDPPDLNAATSTAGLAA